MSASNQDTRQWRYSQEGRPLRPNPGQYDHTLSASRLQNLPLRGVQGSPYTAPYGGPYSTQPWVSQGNSYGLGQTPSDSSSNAHPNLYNTYPQCHPSAFGGFFNGGYSSTAPNVPPSPSTTSNGRYANTADPELPGNRLEYSGLPLHRPQPQVEALYNPLYSPERMHTDRSQNTQSLNPVNSEVSQPPFSQSYIQSQESPPQCQDTSSYPPSQSRSYPTLLFNRPLTKDYVMMGHTYSQLGVVFEKDMPEPVSGDVSGSTAMSGGIWVKKRRLVVIQCCHGHVRALPIHTYHGQGVAAKHPKKSEHVIIYTGDTAPLETDDERRAKLHEKPMKPRSIRVIMNNSTDKLDPMSRLNLGLMIPVQNNVPIRPLGKVHADSMQDLKLQFGMVNQERNSDQARREKRAAKQSRNVSQDVEALNENAS